MSRFNTIPIPETDINLPELPSSAKKPPVYPIGRNNAALLDAEIDSVSFNLFSTFEVDHLAVVNITNTDSEGAGTVRDLSMGPQNRNQVCGTCMRPYAQCPGHFGKIEIPKIMHPLSVSAIVMTLSSVCITCGKLLVTRDDLEKEGILLKHNMRRLRAVRNLVKRVGRQCKNHENVPGSKPCDPQANFFNHRDDKKNYYLKYSFSGTRVEDRKNASIMLPDAPIGEPSIYKILNSITNEDASLMGFSLGSHPRTMVIDRLLVIPWCARPDVFFNRTYHADDLTSRYHAIVLTANAYRNATEETEIEAAISNLYGKVSGLFRADSKVPAGKKKVLNDISKKIQGKEALIRKSIMGKRVNFGGRSVVGPAAFLRADEIGVPDEMAQVLTRPFIVSELNRAEMEAKWDAGKVRYITRMHGPSAGIRTPVNDAFFQRYPDYRLELGDKVERMLQDGDLVMFNRQPTLHKNGVLASYARIIPDRIFRLSLSSTIPINADFDGDEINVHVPQTIEAYAEMEQLMTISKNMLSAKMNRPTFGLVYDALSGSYLMTQPSHELDTLIHEREHAVGDERKRIDERINTLRDRVNLDPVIYNRMIEEIVGTPQYKTLATRLNRYDVGLTTTRGVISGAFPQGFDYTKTIFTDDNTPVHVLIKDGVLVSGYLSGDTLKDKDGGILTELTRQIGGEAAVDFLSIMQFITREYLQQRGLSISLKDCVPSAPEFRKMVNETIDRATLKVMTMTKKTTNSIVAEEQERRIVQTLANTKTETENIIQEYFEPDNSIMIMANSGAKGSVFNTVQMGSTLGQQLVSGKRIPANMAGKRSLAIYPPGEDTPESRGFCRNSFASGLEPQEFFYHAQGGREGISDTAVNTAKTGDLQRKLVKTAEDVHVATDGSTRVDGNSIIEPIYGGDGFNAAMLTNVNIGGEKIPFFRNLEQIANQVNRIHSE